jgi:hypothetical protein
MSGRLGEYVTGELADARRARLAGWLDLLLALVVTMLVWPFPFARATLEWPVHVAAILVAILVVDFTYRLLTLRLWRRTVAMYLLDLGLAARGGGDIALGAAVRWSVGWSMIALPSLVGLRRLADPARGLPVSLSGLETRTTRADT